MKADKSKSYLEQAMRSLPESHHYKDARFYIAKAINEISTTDAKKEGKKATIRQQWEEKLKTNAVMRPMSPIERANALSELDKLIELEQTKIEKAKSPSESSDDVFLD